MKIIIKEEPYSSVPDRYERSSWLSYKESNVYSVYVKETKAKQKVATFATETEALEFAKKFVDAGATLVTSWGRKFRVTTTVVAHDEESALDRLCGDDIEARKQAVVVTI